MNSDLAERMPLESLEGQEAGNVARPARLEELEAQFDRDMAKELVSAYLEDTADVMEKMQESIFNRDGKSLKSHAHMLKGASRIVVAQELEGLCKEMEEYSLGANWLKAEALFEKLNRAFQELVEYLRQYLK